eukprot:8130618-Heterocapsa_arctica.AAC.1
MSSVTSWKLTPLRKELFISGVHPFGACLRRWAPRPRTSGACEPSRARLAETVFSDWGSCCLQQTKRVGPLPSTRLLVVDLSGGVR